jgi:hypothetical protein
MTRTPTALALLAGLLAAPAVAEDAPEETTGLAWQWTEGQSRTYHLAGQLQLSRFVWLRAFNNLEVRITGARLEVVTTCVAAEAAGKKAWELHCTLDDVSMQAAAIPGDRGRVKPILDEWDERLTGATLEVLLRNDGELRDLAWQDMTRRNRRDGENLESVRQLLLRLFSPLDLELPKKGTDGGDGTWDQKSPLVLGFPSMQGTVGTVDLEHTIAAKRGSKVKIQSQGAGTVGDAGSTNTVAGQEQITDFFDMKMDSEATFDTSEGHLVRRQVAASGTPTASSELGDGFEGLPYIQAYRVELMPEGAPAPTLPESVEIDTAFPQLQGG